MKKPVSKLILILSLLITLIFATACAGYKLSDDFDETELENSAEEIISLINQEDSDSLLERSTVALKNALTDKVLAEVYEAIGEGGGFVEILDISMAGKKDKASQEEFAVVVVKAKYELKNFIYTLSFTKQMKLAGLFYR